MPEKIRVHGTKWCGDTAGSRKCLERLGVEYEWVDIEKELDGANFVLWVNKGNRSVPTILFPDGTVLVEPSDAELEEKCRKLANLGLLKGKTEKDEKPGTQ